MWTHLLGLVWFTVELPWVLDRVSAQGGGFADAVCFFLFIACAQFQMFARCVTPGPGERDGRGRRQPERPPARSTAYHLLRCVSPTWDDFLLRVDIVGIVVMVMGSFAVGLHTGFRCRPAYLCGSPDDSRALRALESRSADAAAPSDRRHVPSHRGGAPPRCMRAPAKEGRTRTVTQRTPWSGASMKDGYASEADPTYRPFPRPQSLQSPFMCRVRNALLVGGVAFGVVPVTHVLLECDLECAPLVVPAAASMFGLYLAGAQSRAGRPPPSSRLKAGPLAARRLHVLRAPDPRALDARLVRPAPLVAPDLARVCVARGGSVAPRNGCLPQVGSRAPLPCRRAHKVALPSVEVQQSQHLLCIHP